MGIFTDRHFAFVVVFIWEILMGISLVGNSLVGISLFCSFVRFCVWLCFSFILRRAHSTQSRVTDLDQGTGSVECRVGMEGLCFSSDFVLHLGAK